MIIGKLYFYVLAALAIAGALTTVSNRNPIRGAMGLLLTIIAAAGLFLALHAEFLAFIQLIVYAGAIVVLFIFVIMLLGPDAQPPRDHRGRVPRAFGGALFGLACAGGLWLVWRGSDFSALGKTDPDFGSIDAIGRTLFSSGLVPFELSSALLMIAVVGAVAVARSRHKHDDVPMSAPRPREVTPGELAATPTPRGSMSADLSNDFATKRPS